EDIQVQFLYAVNSKTTIYSTGEQLSGVVTEKFLEELGSQIIETADKPISKSAKTVGFENLVFDYEKIQEALKNSCFNGKYLTAVGKSEWDKMRWDGSAASKKTIVNNADFLFHALIKPEDHVTHIESLNNKKVNTKLLDCRDRKSTRLNSSHVKISYAVFCLKKKKNKKKVINNWDNITCNDMVVYLAVKDARDKDQRRVTNETMTGDGMTTHHVTRRNHRYEV